MQATVVVFLLVHNIKICPKKGFESRNTENVCWNKIVQIHEAEGRDFFLSFWDTVPASENWEKKTIEHGTNLDN